jgi:hypothetical protein
MPPQPTGFVINPPQPDLPPPPPAIEHEGRNYIILQNFDETAIKDKDVQTQILFGRKFSKVRSASPSPGSLLSNILQNPRTPTNSAPSRDIPPSTEILLRACLTAILMLTRRFRG